MKYDQSDRKTWDKTAVGDYVAETAAGKPESKFLTRLNDELVAFYEKAKTPGTLARLTVVSMNDQKEQGKKFDGLVMLSHPSMSEPKAMLRIELEVGATQKNWDGSTSAMRSAWPYGLNILGRKESRDKWDLFIKHSNSCDAFFSITNKDFLAAIERGDIKLKQLSRHSLNMKTCDEVFPISWDKVDEWNGSSFFAMDDYAKLCSIIVEECRRKWKKS